MAIKINYEYFFILFYDFEDKPLNPKIPEKFVIGNRDDQQPEPEQEPEHRSFDRSRSRSWSHF